MAYAAFNPVGFDWSKGTQNIDGTIYAPRFSFQTLKDELGNVVYDENGQPARLMDGDGESANYVQGPATQFVRYNEADKRPGGSYEVYDVSGNLIGHEPFVKEDFGRGGFFEDIFGQATNIARETAPLWMMALGANYLAPGVAGGSGGAAAAPAVDAATAAFLEANMGALAPTVSGGFAPAAVGGGLLGGGGSALSQAGLSTTLGTPLAELTAGGLLTGSGAPALINAPAIAAGSMLGNLPGRAIGGLLGAAAGAANSGDRTQTSQQRLDPRMEAMLYGADGRGGYLGAATDWFNQNRGGNPLMLQGAQMMADFYRSPQYTEGYNSLRSAGLGLLNTPMAGNPFTQGGAQTPAMGGGMPSMPGPQIPQSKGGVPSMQASPDAEGGMMDMRYRSGPEMTPEQLRRRKADMLAMMNHARGFGG